MYEEAASSIQNNGHVSGLIPIHSSVRQGCPMSMLLFVLCVDPLLRTLDQILPGIRIRKRGRKTVVVAYADNITIFVTTPTDVPLINDAIQCYEKAMRTPLNARKSTALAVGGWSTCTGTLNIPYHAEIKILGEYHRALNEQELDERNRQGEIPSKGYIRAGLKPLTTDSFLAKIWHTAQVFPAPTTCTRQLTTRIAWYLWKGATFRVPISTLQKPKRQRGWGLIDIEANCRAILIGRMWTQNMKKGSETETWLREWNLDGPRSNPSHIGRMPMILKYLYRYALHMAYIAPPAMMKRSGHLNCTSTILYIQWRLRRENPEK